MLTRAEFGSFSEEITRELEHDVVNTSREFRGFAQSAFMINLVTSLASGTMIAMSEPIGSPASILKTAFAIGLVSGEIFLSVKTLRNIDSRLNHLRKLQDSTPAVLETLGTLIETSEPQKYN